MSATKALSWRRTTEDEDERYGDGEYRDRVQGTSRSVRLVAGARLPHQLPAFATGEAFQ